ncbi:MAG: hypothetical protein ABI760_19730 [Ferruginibacter sp.]
MNSKSYLHGASATPLLGETIGENLLNTVSKFPERPALICVHQNYRVSYLTFWQQVEDVSRAFLQLI